MFEPILNRRIFEEVSDRIKNLIFEGTLKVGDRLPSETQLAKHFNVSRPTIREALRMLEVSGFITINKGGAGGPTISDTIFHRISRFYYDAFRMKRVTLPELTVARLEIEKSILNHFFDRIDEVGQAAAYELKKNLQTAEKKAAKGLRATKENLDFHRLLAKYTGNHVFVIILESLMAVLGDLLSRLAPDNEAGFRVVKEHADILDAIIKNDRKKAVMLMERHLREIEQRLQLFMDQLEEGSPAKMDTDAIEISR